jgi:hypothetical protein
MLNKMPITLTNFLNVGFIQTNLDEEVAWFDCGTGKWRLPMSKISETQMNAEIEKGFRDVVSYNTPPHIIILPELTLPLGLEKKLEKLCRVSKAIVVAGLDFMKKPHGIENKAVVMAPNNWPTNRSSRFVNKYYIGKTFFSIPEKSMFKYLGLPEAPDHRMYIFHAGVCGRVGIAICSDFFDIERFVIYKGRIQHMIVIAHNIDTESYYFLAEAIARLVYCNVIICNTGFYGDSIAFSPFAKNFNRYIYRHKGKELFATQVVQLPVADLESAQRGNDTKQLFKSPPPGYRFF